MLVTFLATTRPVLRLVADVAVHLVPASGLILTKYLRGKRAEASGCVRATRGGAARSYRWIISRVVDADSSYSRLKT